MFSFIVTVSYINFIFDTIYDAQDFALKAAGAVQDNKEITITIKKIEEEI